MKELILKLRKEGKTYDEIRTEVGCSKGTISYHCGKGQKIKYRNRQRRNRKKINNIINRKIKNFKNAALHGTDPYKRKTTGRFSYASAYEKVLNSQVCYLSGRRIDLSDTTSFHIDHIKPICRGGKNTLKNLGVLRKEVNMAKGGMMNSEFIDLCIDVLKHNGYNIMKK